MYDSPESLLFRVRAQLNVSFSLCVVRNPNRILTSSGTVFRGSEVKLIKFDGFSELHVNGF